MFDLCDDGHAVVLAFLSREAAAVKVEPPTHICVWGVIPLGVPIGTLTAAAIPKHSQ